MGRVNQFILGVHSRMKDWNESPFFNLGAKAEGIGQGEGPETNLCGLEPQLIKLEFIIYLPKLKVSLIGQPIPANNLD